MTGKNVSFTNTGGFFDPRGYSIIKDEFAKLGHPYASPFIVGGSQIANVNNVAGSAVAQLKMALIVLPFLTVRLITLLILHLTMVTNIY